MATRLEDIIAKMPADRRARVEKETKELVAQEMALRDLRKAVHLTQARMAEILGIGQDSVSRLEQRCDLLVSTLRGYIGAMGGRLRLVAELPGRPPVELLGLSNLTGLDAFENDEPGGATDEPQGPHHRNGGQGT